MAIAETTLSLGRLHLEQGDRESAITALRESADLVDSLDLSLPGPLPAAYLALLGEGTVPSVVLPLRCAIEAELHVVLYRLDDDASHLVRAGDLLTRMCRHLDAPDTVRFWATYPVARSYRALAGDPG
jgi:hypothetical protein